MNEKVKLKWTNFLLIAAIVLFLGNINTTNLGSQINELQGSVEKLQRQIGQLEYKLEQKSE